MKLLLRKIDQHWLIYEDKIQVQELRGKIKKLPRLYSFEISYNSTKAILQTIQSKTNLHFLLENGDSKFKATITTKKPIRFLYWSTDSTKEYKAIKKVKKIKLFSGDALVAILRRKTEQKSIIEINEPKINSTLIIGLLMPYVGIF